MKKSFLLLMAGLIAGYANGQSVKRSVVLHESTGTPVTVQNLPAGETRPVINAVPVHATAHGVQHSGAKTTSGGDRWYFWGYEFLQPYEQSLGKDVNYIGDNLWNDTTGLWGYTGTVSGPYAPYQYN